MNALDSTLRDEQSSGHAEEHSVEGVLRLILDLTVAMERNAETENYDKVAVLMGYRDALLGEFSTQDGPVPRDPAQLGLFKEIERENSILVAQLQQKRDSIADRLHDMNKARAIANYRQ